MSEKFYSSDETRNFVRAETLEQYKKFAFKDDMMKLSVGFILGNSFNKVVCGISDYLVMPMITYVMSSTGEKWREIRLEPVSGLSLEVGRLAGVFADFFMVSIILYLVYIKFMGDFMKYGPAPAPLTKQCPQCFSAIRAEAKKCPMCCTGGLIVEKRRTRSKNKGTKGT